MKLVVLSDTHNKHNQVKIPKCDILLHCGDFTARGRKNEVKNFFKWFNKQPAHIKIYIAGNHDLSYQTHKPILSDYGNKGQTLIYPHPGLKEEILEQYENIIYLENSGIWINNIYIWGSPYSPQFKNWAFEYKRKSKEAKNIWSAVPDYVTVLITHGPPKGVLDYACNNPPHPQNAGCSVLKDMILKKKPKVACFGHIHEQGRQEPMYLGETTCYNVSICNLKYQVINKPIEIEV